MVVNPTTKVGFRLLVLLMVPVLGFGQYKSTHTGAELDAVLTDHPLLRSSFDSLLSVPSLHSSDTSLNWFVTRSVLNPLLAAKQVSGTYLVPGDSVSLRNYSNSLYQPVGTYLIPGDSSNQRTYSNSLYLGLHNTADTSKASYWATSLRTPQDSARASYYATSLRVMPDSSRASYWASAVRGSFIDTSRASYYATSLRVMPDSSRASYWSTRLRGDTTTSAYYATSLRVMPDSSRASYWSTHMRAPGDTSNMATRLYAQQIGTLDTAGMATRTYVVAIGTADTAGMTTVSAVNTLRNADTTRALVRERSAGNGTAYYGAGTWGTNAENQTASTTQLNVSGHMRAFPFFIGKTMTIDSVNYIVSTAAAGACTIAIYTDSAVTGIGPSYPKTQIVLGGRDTTSGTVKAISLRSVPVQMTTGLYWLVVSSNGTATLRSHPMSAVPNVMGYNPAVTATQEYSCYDVTRSYDQYLPSPFTTGGTAVVAITPPLIVFRVKSVP